MSENGNLNDTLGARDDAGPQWYILTANGNDGNIVEVAEAGVLVAKKLVNNTGTQPGGGPLRTDCHCGKVYFVDDGSNTFRLLE